MKHTFFVQKMLFWTSILTSILISLSSNSMITIWMSMEINLFSFIPLMLTEEEKKTEKSIMTYFLNQSIASLIIMVSLILNQNWMWKEKMTLYYMFTLAILIKLGLFPFHYWFISIMEGISWKMNFLLMTIQKIIPITLIMMTNQENFIMNFMIINSIISSFMGLTFLSLRKIMSVSSMNNTSLLVVSIILSKKMFKTYFIIYSFTNFILTNLLKEKNLSNLMQVTTMMKYSKMSFFNFNLTFFSLSGMPPFMGFLPKLFLMLKMAEFSMFMPMLFILLSNSLSMFFYIRLLISTLLMNLNQKKWKYNSKTSTKPLILIFSPLVILSWDLKLKNY